jgi:sugar phosphate isomerase/epimerase
MIFVSTGGVQHKKATETALELYENGLNHVELSGGKYSKDLEYDLKCMPIGMCLQVHNYFPPPEKPFVFNLASPDKNIGRLSIEHVSRAIKLSTMLGRPIYSFHAGFCVDPKVKELGAQLEKRKLLPRNEALSIFGERVTLLAEEARREGVSLLVENNVINRSNFDLYGEDPLLLTSPDEICWFMERMPSNVGLLLDVAHLKVSSSIRSFDLGEAHERVRQWIKGYHLSDNDGISDTNHPVLNNSWFWEHLKPDIEYCTLEVYRQSPKTLLEQCLLTKQMMSQRVDC